MLHKKHYSSHLLILLFVAFSLNSGAEAQPPEVSGYQLSWFDEFNGSTLDQSKWTPVFSTNPTNFSLHAYLPENVMVSGGNLVLLSTNIPFNQLGFRSGQVISKSAHRYGRFEVRGKLPTSQGMWPAIWLLPDIPPLWPSQGEIDIMENRGNQPNLTSSAFHWGTNPPYYHNFVFDEFEFRKNGSPLNFHDSFHTYATEWDPEQIRFYVDGVHYYTIRNNGVENFMTTGQTNPMRLIINTAIGGTFLPNPDATTQWPQTFDVDYVYVYDRTGTPNLQIENGDFETNSGSIANWSLFGNNGSNIGSSNAQSLSGANSLKLFGQYNGGENFSGVEQGVSVEPGDQIVVRGNVFVDSSDSIAGTGNQAFLKFDFYNEQYGAFGSDQYIGSSEVMLANGSTPNNQWLERELSTTVPAGAVEARVAIVFRQVSNQPGAVFVDDISFTSSANDQVVAVSTANVTTGNLLAGDPISVFNSDDDYLIAEPDNSNPNSVALTMVGTPTLENVNRIEFDLESSVNTPGLDLIVEAFNHQTVSFEQLLTQQTSLVDTSINVSIDDDASAYLSNSNSIIFRITWSKSSPVLFHPWKVLVDRAKWTVGQ